MENQDKESFIERIEQLSKPENKTSEMAEENREAIEYLATEIAEIKEQGTTSTTTGSETELEETLKDLQSAVKLLAKLQKETNTAVYTLAEELLQEEEETEVEKETEEETEEEEEEEETEEGTHNYTNSGMEVIETLSADEWKSSPEITEEIESDIGQRAVQRRMREFVDEGLVESGKSMGYRLTEEGKEFLEAAPETRKASEKDFECLLCGKTYNDSRGLASHLNATHNINNSNTEERPTDKYNAATKTQQEISEIKDELGHVETPVDTDKDFPKFENGETIEDPTHWSIEERETLTKQILDEAEKPLTRTEIAKEMYNLDEEPKFAEPHYNAMSSFIKEMADEGEIVEAERMDAGGKAYALPNSSQDVSLTQPESDEPVQEQAESSKVSDATHVLEQIDGVDGRKEFNLYTNTFAKLVYQEDMDEITYYDFSGAWGGKQQPIDAFRKIFQSPTVLNGIRKEVCPDKSFSWNSKGDGGKPTNWILEISD